MNEAERKAWLEERRTGIGGSDVANILGEGYQTPLDVYLSKIGEVKEIDGPAIKRGRALEPIILQLYREQTGTIVHTGRPMERDPKYPELIANVDGTEAYEKGWAIVEVKAPGYRSFAKMKGHGVPKAYYLQMQHYLGVTGYEYARFLAFNADRWELLHFTIERDDLLIEQMRAILVEWWHNHVVKRRPPEAEKYDIPVDATASAGEVTIIDTPHFRDAVRRFFEARELVSIATQLEEETSAEILAMMGECMVVEGGGARFIHRFAKGRTTFDQKALEAAQPLDRTKVAQLLDSIGGYPGHPANAEMLDRCTLDLSQFYRVGKPSRPFRPYLLKGGLTGGE